MRLDANSRAQIVNGALTKHKARAANLYKRELELLRRCYEAVIPPEFSKKMDALQAASPIKSAKWFYTSTHLRFNVGGQTVEFNAYHTQRGTLGYPERDRTEWRIPSFDTLNSYGSITIDKHKQLVEDVRKWQGDTEDYANEYHHLYTTLNKLVKSISTTEKLFAVWPEGQQFYAAPPLTSRPANVSLVDMKNLNEKLGLAPAK